MKNLSQAILEARKRHEEEVAQRLLMRKKRQEQELHKLNQFPSSTEPTRAEAMAVQSANSLELYQNNLVSLKNNEFIPATSVLRSDAEANLTVEPEAPPNSNYTKLSNTINDQLKKQLTSSGFSVYVELYRQTIGRGKSGSWFRTREIQKACGFGSDNTVRKAFVELEASHLIKIEKNPRLGSPKGLFITTLSVEKALVKMTKKAQKSAAAKPTSALQHPRTKCFSTSAVSADPIYIKHVRHADDDETPSSSMPDSTQPENDDDDLRTKLIRELNHHGLTPNVTPGLISKISDADLSLIPYLLQHLDRTVKTTKVTNPAGLLRVWLSAFESWKPELEAAKNREEAEQQAIEAETVKNEQMMQWYEFVEQAVNEKRQSLPATELAQLQQAARSEISRSSPSTRHWDENTWTECIEEWVRNNLRKSVPTFEEWLDRDAGIEMQRL
ncbi:MAG: replication protein [Blastocatellia bacterium]|nr:replication protein [Blastocatellia bacterium]